MEKTIEAYDTSLALGLTYAGRSSSPSTDHHHLRTPYFKQEPWVSDQSPLAPSLTLGLSGDVYASTQMKITQIKASPEATPAGSSSPSIISSFSKSGSEEAERVLSSRVSYKDQEKAVSAGKKLRLTREQSALLEDRFMENSKLNYKQKQALSKQLNLRPRQVEVWFQNRRARTKKKQSEVECHALRRYCERLTDENRRLKKELRELKAFNLASSPSHVQVPAGVTRTVCPSCERVSGEASEGGSFAAAPTKQKFNTFTRAAAC